MPYNSESAWWLSKIRETFKKDKARGLEAAQLFDKMRQDPSSQFYEPFKCQNRVSIHNKTSN